VSEPERPLDLPAVRRPPRPTPHPIAEGRPEPGAEPPGRIDVGTVLAAMAVLAVGLSGAGAGFANGDAAVYAAQGAAGDLSQRVVHVGYVAIAAALAPLAGDDLPRWLDAVTALACALTTLGAGRLAATYGRPPWVAAAVTGAMLLPIASSAEADPLWVAPIVWAAAVRTPWRAALLAAAAVPISPLALLGLSWVWTIRWTRTVTQGPKTVRAWMDAPNPTANLWFAALVTVLVLTIVTGGAWWTGDRGVLSAPWPRPWRVAQAWAAHGVPWWSAPLLAMGWVIGGGPGLLAPWPLFLAPPDAHTWPLFTVSLALIASAGVGWLLSISRQATLALVALAAVDPVLGWVRHERHLDGVRADEAAIRDVLAGMGPNDGLVASWSWGVRASVRATGQPYALAWRVPGEPVRDPAAWCATRFDHVWVLPPSALPAHWTGEPAGAAWRVPGDVAAAHPLSGCPSPEGGGAP